MALDLANVLIGAAITIVVGAGGFLARRWFTGEKSRESAELFSKHASIAALLKEKGLTVEDVDQVGDLIKAKMYGKRLEPKPTIVIPASPEEPYPYWTQSAMNARGLASRDVAEAQLNAAIVELSTLVDSDQQAAFDEAQRAWEVFRDRQVDLAGLPVVGGSLEHLLRAVEAETMAKQRLTDIQASVEQYKQPL